MSRNQLQTLESPQEEQSRSQNWNNSITGGDFGNVNSDLQSGGRTVLCTPSGSSNWTAGSRGGSEGGGGRGGGSRKESRRESALPVGHHVMMAAKSSEDSEAKCGTLLDDEIEYTWRGNSD